MNQLKGYFMNIINLFYHRKEHFRMEKMSIRVMCTLDDLDEIWYGDDSEPETDEIDPEAWKEIKEVADGIYEG